MREKYHIVTFYKFVRFSDYVLYHSKILNFCTEKDIKGTILLASEGLNGTIAGKKANIQQFLQFLKSEDRRFYDIKHKESFSNEIPFNRMKVKLKKEIVTLGQPNIYPSEKSGVHVAAKNWNTLIKEPDVLLIDTRNEYEHQIGTFEGAISPQTTNFREFSDFVKQKLDPNKNKKVAIFCTGGIRCEKASAYMLNQGFKNVYQLDGGILKYLEDIDHNKSLWHGECFVFDSRVSVDYQLAKGKYEQCYACRRPLSEGDLQSKLYKKGVACPHCIHEKTDNQREGFSERQRQVELAEKRNRKHIGAQMN